ncbi:unnamed protein product [Chrysodeixis includens]|uniref:Uncharacterized protein n=1 Tax=Chrysodeixis includens TaxID=689277 RepID=A0A9P0FSW4_CHRIL|nr:unnamed protein product [Chrysodeixis includens]
MYMLFAVRWQHDEQPSGGAALPRILHVHHIAAPHFTIPTTRMFLVPSRTVINTYIRIFNTRIVFISWTFHFIVSVTWFIYFGDRVFRLVAVNVLVGLSEHLLHVDGELGPDDLREGQQSAGDVHGVVNVSVP